MIKSMGAARPGCCGSQSRAPEGWSGSSLLALFELQARDMQEIDNLSGAVLIRYPDGPPTGHDPEEIGMGDFKPPLVGEINRKGLEGSFLPRFFHLFCRHA